MLDHSGFSEGQQDHLVAGWSANYREPLTEYLG
jgi:hypothetical protein